MNSQTTNATMHECNFMNQDGCIPQMIRTTAKTFKNNSCNATYGRFQVALFKLLPLSNIEECNQCTPKGVSAIAPVALLPGLL